MRKDGLDLNGKISAKNQTNQPVTEHFHRVLAPEFRLVSNNSVLCLEPQKPVQNYQ